VLLEFCRRCPDFAVDIVVLCSFDLRDSFPDQEFAYEVDCPGDFAYFRHAGGCGVGSNGREPATGEVFTERTCHCLTWMRLFCRRQANVHSQMNTKVTSAEEESIPTNPKDFSICGEREREL
jgi:hypothetical protein